MLSGVPGRICCFFGWQCHAPVRPFPAAGCTPIERAGDASLRIACQGLALSDGRSLRRRKYLQMHTDGGLLEYLPEGGGKAGVSGKGGFGTEAAIDSLVAERDRTYRRAAIDRRLQQRGAERQYRIARRGGAHPGAPSPEAGGIPHGCAIRWGGPNSRDRIRALSPSPGTLGRTPKPHPQGQRAPRDGGAGTVGRQTTGKRAINRLDHIGFVAKAGQRQ